MEFLIFLVLAAGAIILVRKGRAWLRLRQQQRHTQLIQLAHKHGWILDDAPPESLGYRLHGTTDGIHWRLETERGAGSDASTSTKWSTESVNYADLVGLIRTRKGYDLLQSMWGRAASGLLQAMTSVVGLPAAQHADLLREGKRLRASASEMEENYVLIVRPERGLDGLLTRELEAALLNWIRIDDLQKDTLSVDIGQTNLRVYCQYFLAPEHIEPFVKVGVATARALER